MLKILTTLLVISVYGSACSQVMQTYRYEKEESLFTDDDNTIVPLKKDGIALVKGTKEYKSGKRTWKLIQLDTVLKEVFELDFEIDNRNSLIGYEHSPGYGHFLFVRNEPNSILEIITIHLSTKEMISYKINPELSFKLSYFHKVGDNFIFGGVVNFDPCILIFNPKNENLKLVPGFFKKETELVDVRPNQNATFNTVLIDRANVGERKITFKTFDASGNQLFEDLTTIDNTISISTGITSKLIHEDLLVVGTWGKRNSKSAIGFYTLQINPFTDGGIKPIYFGELEHYLDYLKPKRAKAIKLKTKKALEANKVPEFANHVMPYKILEHSKGFLVLAESFTTSTSPNQYYSPYPAYAPYSYASPYGAYYPNYGRGYTPLAYGNNIQTVDENKKIENIAINLDAAGNVLWDYSLKFSDVKTQTFQNLSELWITNDSLYLLYKKESELKVKSISLSTQESVESLQKIKLNEPLDEITSESPNEGTIESWYANKFYTWGHHTIRNKSKDTTRRKVFYINKLEIK